MQLQKELFSAQLYIRVSQLLREVRIVLIEIMILNFLLVCLFLGAVHSFHVVHLQRRSQKASAVGGRGSSTALGMGGFRSKFVSESEIAKSQQKGPAPPINENIDIPTDEVRLIAPKEDGEPGEEEMLGIFSLEEALEKAEEYELDLVLINEDADPPVCKIIDYGKYKYQLEKRKKDNAKKQIKVDQKEVKLSYKIEQHDFDVRVRSAKKFLTSGDRVSFCTAITSCSYVAVEVAPH